MAEQIAPPTRYVPARTLPPYAYVPGHDLPHPVNDPAGHLYSAGDSHREPPISCASLADVPNEALAAVLSGDSRWLFALDLFHSGFYWEAHEAWEAYWHVLGRTTPEAKFVQGLIHLAAACVKIREGRSAGVKTHTGRARALMGQMLGEVGAGHDGGAQPGNCGTLGLAPASIVAVLSELENYRPECWHTSRFSVVRVLAAELRLAN